MVRLNITMPDDLAGRLKRIKNKSGFIAQALREKFQRAKKKSLEHGLVEGYKKMTLGNKKIVGDWDGTAGDGVV